MKTTQWHEKLIDSLSHTWFSSCSSKNAVNMLRGHGFVKDTRNLSAALILNNKTLLPFNNLFTVCFFTKFRLKHNRADEIKRRAMLQGRGEMTSLCDFICIMQKKIFAFSSLLPRINSCLLNNFTEETNFHTLEASLKRN